MDGLFTACKRGDLQKVKYLVSIGCDPKVDDNSAIRLASENGHLEVVKYLVSIGCNPKACDNSAIREALIIEHLEVVKYLFEIGCDHEIVRKSIKLEVLQECKAKLLIFMQTVRANKYLKMDILKVMLPQFTELEIFKII